MNDTPCRCACGYTCKRQCGLDIMACIEQHYKRDCDHDFSGPLHEMGDDGLCQSVVCQKCGVSAIGHDMAVGP